MQADEVMVPCSAKGFRALFLVNPSHLFCHATLRWPRPGKPWQLRAQVGLAPPPVVSAAKGPHYLPAAVLAPVALCRRAPGSGLLSAPAASRGCSTGPVPYTSAALGRPHSHGASTGTPPAPRLHLPPKWHLAAFLTSAAQAAPAGHCWSPTAAALMRPLEPPCRQTQEGHPERLAPGLSITASSSAGSRLPAAPTRRWGLIPGPPCSCSSSNP